MPNDPFQENQSPALYTLSSINEQLLIDCISLKTKPPPSPPSRSPPAAARRTRSPCPRAPHPPRPPCTQAPPTYFWARAPRRRRSGGATPRGRRREHSLCQPGGAAPRTRGPTCKARVRPPSAELRSEPRAARACAHRGAGPPPRRTRSADCARSPFGGRRPGALLPGTDCVGLMSPSPGVGLLRGRGGSRFSLSPTPCLTASSAQRGAGTTAPEERAWWAPELSGQ